MENTKRKIKKIALKNTFFTAVMRYTLSAVLSFVFSLGRFTPEIAPLGIAFTSSVKKELLPVAAAGSVLGYFVSFGFGIETLRYAAAVIIAVISLYALETFISDKYRLLIPSLSVMLSVFLTGITVAVSTEISLKIIAVFLLESIIGAVSAYFFCTVFNLPAEKRFTSRLNGTEISAVLVFIGEIILSLNGVSLWFFSLSGVVGTVVVLTGAVYGKEKGGALLGICTGLVLSMRESMGFVAGAFALGGLLSGISGRKNRFAASLVFMLANGIIAIPSANWISAVNLLYDICAGCIIVMLIPPALSEKLKILFSDDEGITAVQGQKQILKMRLLTASDSLSDVSKSVNSVLKIFERRWEPNLKDCLSLVYDNVCENCEKYGECMHDKTKTAEFIKAVTLKAKNYGCYTKDDLPDNGCLKPYDVFLTVNNEYNRFRNLTLLHNNISKTSYIATDQLVVFSDYLGRLSDRLNDGEDYISDKSLRLSSCLKDELGLFIITCGVFSDNGKLYAEIYTKIGNRENITPKIRKLTSVMLNREMELPVADTLNDSTVIIRMCEKTVYSVNYGGSQLCADNENWCGDSFDCFNDGRGNLIMILSDGMGTGKRAAADSVMTRSLASSLIRADFGCENVPDIINSSMMLRSSEESTATLDIARINLYTGSVTIYKAGASFSYIARNGKFLKFEKASMPLGILRNVKFEKIETRVKDGDIFIMMSDGVDENSKDAFKDIVSSDECESGEKLSRRLAEGAYSYDKSGHHDDITVITGIISKNM